MTQKLCWMGFQLLDAESNRDFPLGESYKPSSLNLRVSYQKQIKFNLYEHIGIEKLPLTKKLLLQNATAHAQFGLFGDSEDSSTSTQIQSHISHSTYIIISSAMLLKLDHATINRRFITHDLQCLDLLAQPHPALSHCCIHLDELPPHISYHSPNTLPTLRILSLIGLILSWSSSSILVPNSLRGEHVSPRSIVHQKDRRRG